MSSISVVLPVKLADEWQYELAEFCITTMQMRTKKKYELVIAESGGNKLKDICQRHVKCASDSNFVRDFNQGAELATGEYIVHTAIDVLVGDQWLEALIEPFEKYEDCGVSTVSVTEPGAVVGEKVPSRKIIEGMYGPIMMFRRGWLLDEAFTGLHSDSDLVMRIYQAGMRSYRNHRSVAFHLDGITWRAVTNEAQRAKQRKEADMLFRSRYQDSPLWMAKVILRGGVVYGREHE